MPQRSTHILGRDEERGVLEAVLSRVKDGGHGTVILEGEAGIGKSTLIESLMDSGTHARIRSFIAGADEMDQELPFGLVSQLLQLDEGGDMSNGGVSDHWFPAATAERPDPLTPPVAAGFEDDLVDLVEALSVAGPMLLVFEDLHWGDAPSLKALRRLTRRVPELPLGIVASLRPTRRPEVASLVSAMHQAGAEHMVVKPLAAGALRALAESKLGAPPGLNLMDKLARTAGNPFLAQELLRAYEQDDLFVRSPLEVDVSTEAFPPSISNLVLRRVYALGKSAVGVLRRAAILGTSFDIRDLEAVTSSDRRELLGMLEQGVDAGLLRDEGEHLAFHHELVREALYLDLPEALRKEIHSDVARILAERGASSLTVASHVSRNPHIGDAFDIEWLERAAAEASESSPATAAELLSQVVTLYAAGDPIAPKTKAQQLRMTIWAGDAPGAEALARSYLVPESQLDAEAEADVRLTLIRSLIGQSRFPDAMGEFDAAEKTAPSGAVRARILAEGAFLHVFVGMVERSRELAMSAITEAEGCNDHFARACASWALALTSLAKGRCDEALEQCQRGLKDAEVTDDPEFSRGPYLSMAAAPLVWCEHFEDAEQVLRNGIQLLTNAGSGWMLSVFYAGLGHIKAYKGQWDDALAEFETSIRLGEENGNEAPLAGVRAVQAQILARRDGPEAAQQTLAAAQQLIDESPGTHINGPDVARAHAMLSEMHGDADTALAILTNMWQMTSMMELHGIAVAAATDAALIALRHERDEIAGGLVSTLDLEVSLPATVDGARMCALGSIRRSRDLIEEGLVRLRDGKNGLIRDLWLEQAASSLGHLDRKERARDLFVEAATGLDQLGAMHDLARVQRRARLFGFRIEKGGAKSKARSGWEALTKTEKSIALLVHDGLRNSEIAEALFVSPRTVETHLTSVYRKLSLRSRSELVRLVGKGQGD